MDRKVQTKFFQECYLKKFDFFANNFGLDLIIVYIIFISSLNGIFITEI